jgi:hypothetical protein
LRATLNGPRIESRHINDFLWRNSEYRATTRFACKKVSQNEFDAVLQTVNKLADVLKSMLRDRTRYWQVTMRCIC